METPLVQSASTQRTLATEPSSELLTSVYWMITFANTVLSGMLIHAAVLKETPEFWTKAGGYPILLCQAVFWLYYPSLLASGIGVALGSFYALWLHKTTGRPAWALLIPCLFQMLGVGVACLITLLN